MENVGMPLFGAACRDVVVTTREAITVFEKYFIISSTPKKYPIS
jgi:hypothetical protein